MIKAMEYNHEITRKIPGKGTYFKTTFVADTGSDIAEMNKNGSEYLNYPAGSAVIAIDSGTAYILNASESEYVEV